MCLVVKLYFGPGNHQPVLEGLAEVVLPLPPHQAEVACQQEGHEGGRHLPVKGLKCVQRGVENVRGGQSISR